jgi:peptidoglycan-associated lipoprotein
MKISRMIMSLCAAAFLGLLAVGCHNEPVDLGPVPAPTSGKPSGNAGADGILYDEYGNPINGGKGGGAPGGWGDGAGNLPARDNAGSGEFSAISIPGLHFEAIYFEYDRSDLKASEMDKLRKVATFMGSRPELGLIIEGHCDDRGSEEYNRALGERRAISLRDQLVKLGVKDENMKTISYGKDRPAVQGASADARSRNRRGETIPAQIQ